VYKVNHWGQSFAVKIFKGDAHERAWLRELGSMSFLSHSNIVRMFYIVYDSIDDRARAHPPAGFAMELMARSAGDNISCTTEQLLELFIQIAGALSYSHDLGVVHFDVKPENILLNESCTVAKLCDFGCAHKLQIAAASASTSAMTFRGTLMYMAPEVINGNVVDAKLCDIYSFGKTMFSLLDPKANASVMISMQQCNTSHLVHVPEALRRLIEMCTDENFAKRPQSMTQIFRKLQEIQKISRLSLFQQNESCEPLVDIPTIRLRPRLLLANGVSLNELDRIGYSAAELKEDGCSAKDICDYFPTEVIKDLGFSPLLLLECGSENFKKLHGFFTAGYTIHELKNAGFSAQQFLALVNYGDFQSQQYITSISELDVKWLIEGGFSFSVLRRCNFDASTLANSGCNAQQLKDAGFTVQQLKQAGLAPKWLLAGGWTAAELSSRLGDSATFSVSEMHEAGADPKSLAECGYTRRDLLACGYQLSQLSDAGMSTSCSLRDCCINVFDYAGCDQIPRASDEENEDSWQFIFWPLVPFQILWLGFCLILSSRPNDCRFFNWFFHPFDAFLGMHTLTNLATTLEFRYFKENDFCKEWCCICAQPFYFFISFVGLVYGWVCSVFSILGCLPCCICFNLSRFVWKYKSSCNDSVFWIIYTCMLHMAMSGRWLWKILCCRRSCFGLARGPCGPSCKLNHGDDPCILCGRPSSQHGDLWHSCLDGRRGSFLWTGIE
jgi:serine/threonine protein kinase